MSTRPITYDDAAAAAELVRLVRERPIDRIDPFPPARETEVLADSGARGKGPDRHPLVAVEGEGDGELIVGYGALDCSAEMRRAHLVGPVVHPAHRRQGHGGRLVEGLLRQARKADQKFVGASVGAENRASHALLEASGFKRNKTYSRLRISRPANFPELEMHNIRIRRVTYDHASDVVDFTQKMVPRRPKQVRSLLKADDYAILVAYNHKDQPVGFAELDLRYGDVATVEQVDGTPSLIQKGLGNLLLARLMPIAFANARVRHFELLATADRASLEEYGKAGFSVSGEVYGYEIKI